MTAKAPSLYQTITTELLEELKRGVAPWVPPWTAGDGGVSLLSYNALTGKRYHGVNVLILWHAALVKGYRSPAWIGYHQTQDLGDHVKEGEKSTVIVYGSTFVPKGERGQPEEEQKRVPFLKKRIVFNVEQTAGLPERVSRPIERAPLPDALPSSNRSAGRLERRCSAAGIRRSIRRASISSPSRNRSGSRAPPTGAGTKAG